MPSGLSDTKKPTNATPPAENPSQTTATARRRPRKLKRNDAPEAPESVDGGVVISPTKQPTQEKVVKASTEAVPSTERRKPPKLNPPSSTSPVVDASIASGKKGTIVAHNVDNEIESLKKRLKEVENQVQALLQRQNPPPAQLPRRRGRGRKSKEESPNEELQELRDDLTNAQEELETLQAGVTDANEPQQPTEEEDVETIPRVNGPEIQPRSETRSVSLTGSYNIPLPPNMNLDDVRAIQNGVASATSVVRSFAAAAHASKREVQNNDAGGVDEPASTKLGWSELFHGATRTITGFLESIEADAAVVAGPQPPSRQRIRRSRSTQALQSPKVASSDTRPTSKDQNSGSMIKRPSLRPKMPSSSQRSVDAEGPSAPTLC